MSTLTVSNLAIRAAGKSLVSDVSLSVGVGQPLTLVGESGSGKSLVLHAIMGSLPEGLSAHGNVQLDERPLLALNPAELRALWGRDISLLPQEPWLALDPTMRIGKQVAEGHRFVRGLGASELRQQVEADLGAVGLAQAQRAYPFEMSGGMCQRAAIAILHGARSALLLADEPTKGLDSALRDSTAARLRSEVERGRLLLTITHDIAVARAIGGTVAVMKEGAIVECGPAEQVLQSPTHAYTRELLQAEPAAWPQRTNVDANVNVAGDQAEPVLSVEALTAGIGDRTLFSGLDLRLMPGEVLSVVGPSGIGKTMLGNILLGLMPPKSGRVVRSAAARPWQFQKIYQDPPSSFPPHEILGRGFDDLMRLHRIDRLRLDQSLAALRIDRSLLARRAGEVSGGELQRLAIARALLLDPVFLFADEVTSRLDLITQREVMEELLQVSRRNRTALLIVTHDRAMASRVSDRIIDLAEYADRSTLAPESASN